MTFDGDFAIILPIFHIHGNKFFYGVRLMIVISYCWISGVISAIIYSKHWEFGNQEKWKFGKTVIFLISKLPNFPIPKFPFTRGEFE